MKHLSKIRNVILLSLTATTLGACSANKSGTDVVARSSPSAPAIDQNKSTTSDTYVMTNVKAAAYGESQQQNLRIKLLLFGVKPQVKLNSASPVTTQGVVVSQDPSNPANPANPSNPANPPNTQPGTGLTFSGEVEALGALSFKSFGAGVADGDYIVSRTIRRGYLNGPTLGGAYGNFLTVEAKGPAGLMLVHVGYSNYNQGVKLPANSVPFAADGTNYNLRLDGPVFIESLNGQSVNVYYMVN